MDEASVSCRMDIIQHVPPHSDSIHSTSDCPCPELRVARVSCEFESILNRFPFRPCHVNFQRLSPSRCSSSSYMDIARIRDASLADCTLHITSPLHLRESLVFFNILQCIVLHNNCVTYLTYRISYRNPGTCAQERPDALSHENISPPPSATTPQGPSRLSLW